MAFILEKTPAHPDPHRPERDQTLIAEEFALSINWGDLSRLDHLVQFYETDDFLLDSVSDFIGAGLGSGAACIVIATPAHREGLAQRLQDNNLDPSSAHTRGKYFALDAAETLAQFQEEQSLNPKQFVKTIGGVIEQAVTGQKRIRIFGEMVALLWQQGNPEAALH